MVDQSRCKRERILRPLGRHQKIFAANGATGSVTTSDRPSPVNAPFSYAVGAWRGQKQLKTPYSEPNSPLAQTIPA